MRQATRSKLAALVLVCAAVAGGLGSAALAGPGRPSQRLPAVRPAAKPVHSTITATQDPRHLVLKLDEASDVRLAGRRLVSRSAQADARRLNAAIEGAGATIERKFSHTPRRVAQDARLDLYFDIDVPAGSDSVRLLDDLNASDVVETAYAPSATSVPDATPDMATQQDYARPAPGGLDSDYASGLSGGDGASVRIVDIEWGWNFSHEDLQLPASTLLSGVIVPGSMDHGTAVLGELVALRNGFGVTGMVPGASVRAVSACRALAPPERSPASDPAPSAGNGWRMQPIGDKCDRHDPAAAIVDATNHLLGSGVPGKVILIELQTVGAATDMYPVEIDQAVYDAIRNAVSSGIVVVEAAGNGGHNLDDYVDASGRHVLQRSYRDSGAIMVGAGCSPGAVPISDCPERTAINHDGWGSNYGSRLDVQGYGERIVTTGKGDWFGAPTNDPNRYYTHAFGGTSGASPMATAAAAAAQGWQIATFGSVSSPAHVRSLLRDTGTAQPASDAQARPIGPQPNLGRMLGIKWWDWALRVEGVDFLSSDTTTPTCKCGEWAPPLNLSATTSSTSYKYAIPGLGSIKQISITASGGTLAVSGQQPATKSSPARSFSRTSALAKGANTTAIKSTYSAGVLTVTIPQS